MKTLVIHLQDPTTEELCLIYKDCKALGDIERVSTCISRDVLKAKINAADTVIMLGHGCDYGLIDITNPPCLFVDQSFGPLFKGKNVIGFFCFAKEFAQNSHISGFFSSMWISEDSEANMFHIPGFSQEYIREECGKLASRINALLSAGVPLSEFPDRLKAANDQHNALTDFNYNGLGYFPADTDWQALPPYKRPIEYIHPSR